MLLLLLLKMISDMLMGYYRRYATQALLLRQLPMMISPERRLRATMAAAPPRGAIDGDTDGAIRERYDDGALYCYAGVPFTLALLRCRGARCYVY